MTSRSWNNGPLGNTPITAAALNGMESDIATAVSSAAASATSAANSAALVGAPSDTAIATAIQGTGTATAAALNAAYAPNGAVPFFPSSAITLNGDSTSTNWPAALASFAGVAVTGLGQGGQTTAQIAARSGAQRATVTVSGNTIPASGGVTITASSVNLVTGAANVSRTGVLADVFGTWSYNGTTQTFTRANPGVAVPCPAGSVFICSEEQYNGNTLVYSSGRNDAYTYPSTYTAGLLAQIRARQVAQAKRALFLSILPDATETTGTANRISLDAKNAACAAQLGESWADFATWFRTDQAFQVAQVAKTAQDITDIGNGVSPTSLRGTGDTLHPNGMGSMAQAWYSAQQLYQRGWSTTNPALPPAPSAPYSMGVDTGITHRWDPALFGYSNGQALLAIPDSVGAFYLSNATTVGARTLVDTGAFKYASILSNGSDSAAFVGPVPSNVPDPLTISMVIQIPGAYTNVIRIGHWYIQAGGAGKWRFFDITGGTGYDSTIAYGTGWHHLIATWNGTVLTFSIDGVVVTNAGTFTGTGTPGNIILGGATGTLNVANVTTWGSNLTTTDMATVRTAMKAKFAVLP